MTNDGLLHEVIEVLALVEEQLADLAVVEEEQATLTATGAAAGGSVEVTVDAHGQVVKAVIDEAYLDEHEFEDLADHITEAAGVAVGEVRRRLAVLMAPISARCQGFPASSEVVEGAPDLRDVVPSWLDSVRRRAGGTDS